MADHPDEHNTDDQTKETQISASLSSPVDDGTQVTQVTRQNPGTEKMPPLATEDETPADEDVEEHKYEVLKPLGKGGFAWVYLVRNVDLDRKEAIKILNVDLTEDPDVVNRFVKEARIAAKFLHQNIVTIYEVHKRGTWQDFQAPLKIRERHREPFVFFTMSFVEGDTAASLVRRGRLPQREAISIVIDACAALDYAHGRGVVHRDIKPDNILVDRRGRGIVMDFGIAKAADQTRQTAAGTFMGTARYVSPEQAMGREIDGRSDIYSLGITLYELVTGRVPFDSDQWMTVLYQHINEPPPSPEAFFGEIDRDLRAVILKMLEKKPENRFQSAADVMDTLKSIQGHLGGVNRHTQVMDDIKTRPDLKQLEDRTAHTELPAPKVAEPPRRTEVREKQTQEREAVAEVTPEAPSSPVPKIVAGVVILGILAVLGWVFRPKPPVVPDPVPVRNGQLLVSAFPKGSIVQITNEQGESIATSDDALPQVLSLPEGRYRLIISYQGRTQEIEGFVSPDMPLSKTHAEFELEPESLLLEDLR
ncbi:Non-specific serine/threonine protein kinase [Sulfidibacter corallicola]|uniref:non-specific serine/threonine protein kinase n=1 Tax=Sulfidibacter corallicola TaxID=2818388 RepID=A0A8A4TYV3_SULCO|nr:serine/threonine-protein kinase [Sulfidibacter corallicola]QTD54132.1 serine/threonine protein kinase [Sulfidibacter corallicola]